MEAFETIRVQLECIRDSIGETPVKYRHAAVVALKELAALEARLAVLGKVEEMLKRPDGISMKRGLHVEERNDGAFEVRYLIVGTGGSYRMAHGATLLDALAALADGKEGG